jgi:hypothetical protein
MNHEAYGLLVAFLSLPSAFAAGPSWRVDYLGFTVWLNCQDHAVDKFRYNAQHDSGTFPRSSTFRLDPAVTYAGQPSSTNSFKTTAKAALAYDRGHPMPANPLDYSELTVRQSYLMTNILPQEATLNRGLGYGRKNFWKLVIAGDSLYVYLSKSKPNILESGLLGLGYHIAYQPHPYFKDINMKIQSQIIAILALAIGMTGCDGDQKISRNKAYDLITRNRYPVVIYASVPKSYGYFLYTSPTTKKEMLQIIYSTFSSMSTLERDGLIRIEIECKVSNSRQSLCKALFPLTDRGKIYLIGEDQEEYRVKACERYLVGVTGIKQSGTTAVIEYDVGYNKQTEMSFLTKTCLSDRIDHESIDMTHYDDGWRVD